MVIKKTVRFHHLINSYFYIDDKSLHGFLIDPGGEPYTLLTFIKENNFTIEAILLTHGHYDHIGAADAVRKELDIPIFAYKTTDDYLLDSFHNRSSYHGPGIHLANVNYLDEGDEITLSLNPDFKLKVLHTPGHTHDSISFYSPADNLVFVGDLIYKGGIGKYSLYGGNKETIFQSIMNKIFTLPDDTLLYSGHSDVTKVINEKSRSID